MFPRIVRKSTGTRRVANRSPSCVKSRPRPRLAAANESAGFARMANRPQTGATGGIIVNVSVVFETRRKRAESPAAPGRPGEKERKVNPCGVVSNSRIYLPLWRDGEGRREGKGGGKHFSPGSVFLGGGGGRSRDRPSGERQRGIAPRQTPSPLPSSPLPLDIYRRFARCVSRGSCGPSSARKFPGWSYLCVAIKGLLKRRFQFTAVPPPSLPLHSAPVLAPSPAAATADALSTCVEPLRGKLHPI